MGRGGGRGGRGRGGGGFNFGGPAQRKSVYVRPLTSLRPSVGYLRDDACEIIDDTSMKELYEHGFFGKGTVSRRQPNRAMLLPQELVSHILSHAGGAGGMQGAAAAAVASGLVQGAASRRPRPAALRDGAAGSAAGAADGGAGGGVAPAAGSIDAPAAESGDAAQAVGGALGSEDAGAGAGMAVEGLDASAGAGAGAGAGVGAVAGGATAVAPSAKTTDHLTLLCADFETHISRAALPNAFYAAAAASCHGHDALSFEAARQIVRFFLSLFECFRSARAQQTHAYPTYTHSCTPAL